MMRQAGDAPGQSWARAEGLKEGAQTPHTHTVLGAGGLVTLLFSAHHIHGPYLRKV